MLTRAVLTVVLLLLPACHAQRHRAEFTRLCMGVHTRIVVFSHDPSTARQAAAAAFDRIAELDRVMSDYRPDSELSRLCEAPAGTPHAVSADLFEVLRTSLWLCQLTGGAFDPTLGPSVALWREARRGGQLPSPDVIAEARSRTGCGHISLDPARRTATLARPGMRLDLGGIGKGYAAQQAVELLGRRGHPRCLVALSGDVVVGAPPPERRGWIIDTPRGPIELAHAAVSTSGDDQQFIEIAGVRYAHILDPRTGVGLTHCPTITVVAPRGELADALATAGCVLGPDAARAVVSSVPGCRMP